MLATLSRAFAASLLSASVLAGPAFAQKGPGTSGEWTDPGPGGQLTPDLVVRAVAEGLQTYHEDFSTPSIVWPARYGQSSPCGPLPSSAYCPMNHTVYIAQEDAQLAYRWGDAALAYVVAHEYAHAMQRAYSIYNADTPSNELEADCLAGYYLAAIPNVTFDESDIYEIRNMAEAIGDYDFMHPNHHGTPQQRINAVISGIRDFIGGAPYESCLYAY